MPDDPLSDPLLVASMPLIHALAHDETKFKELDAALVELGIAKLGQRLKIKQALLATAVPPPASESEPDLTSSSEVPESTTKPPEIDWSKSNFYLEAEALAASMPMRSREQAPAQEWWIVSSERLAVRDAPTRFGKALYVWRKGAVIKVQKIEPHRGQSGREEMWVQLAETEVKHLFLRQVPEGGAWMLVGDGESDSMLTPVPEEAMKEIEGRDGEQFFDERLSPDKRGAAAAAKAAAALARLEKQRETEANERKEAAEAAQQGPGVLSESLVNGTPVHVAGDPGLDVAESDPGMDVDVDDIVRRIEQAPGGGNYLTAAVASYKTAAGPSRPPWMSAASSPTRGALSKEIEIE